VVAKLKILEQSNWIIEIAKLFIFENQPFTSHLLATKEMTKYLEVFI